MLKSILRSVLVGFIGVLFIVVGVSAILLVSYGLMVAANGFK